MIITITIITTANRFETPLKFAWELRTRIEKFENITGEQKNAAIMWLVIVIIKEISGEVANAREN